MLVARGASGGDATGASQSIESTLFQIVNRIIIVFAMWESANIHWKSLPFLFLSPCFFLWMAGGRDGKLCRSSTPLHYSTLIWSALCHQFIDLSTGSWLFATHCTRFRHTGRGGRAPIQVLSRIENGKGWVGDWRSDDEWLAHRKTKVFYLPKSQFQTSREMWTEFQLDLHNNTAAAASCTVRYLPTIFRLPRWTARQADSQH